MFVRYWGSRVTPNDIARLDKSDDGVGGKPCGDPGNLTKAFRALGMAAIRYDIKYCSKTQNFVIIPGCALAIYMLLRVMELGGLHGGMKCSLWIWISSSIHKRSPDNILGDISRQDVRDASRAEGRPLIIE